MPFILFLKTRELHQETENQLNENNAKSWFFEKPKEITAVTKQKQREDTRKPCITEAEMGEILGYPTGPPKRSQKSLETQSTQAAKKKASQQICSKRRNGTGHQKANSATHWKKKDINPSQAF